MAGAPGEWLLQSPLHVAAYSGDKERLLEILEDSKEWGSHLEVWVMAGNDVCR